MKTTILNPSVYVGTYAKYNEGSIFGKWVNLTDFTNIKDFYLFCFDLHKDEHDPELMFQDWENFPENTIWECSIDNEVFDLLQLDEHDQKQVLIYQNATGYKLAECLNNFENMNWFYADDLENTFFEYYPNLIEFQNNPYINIDFKAFADDWTKVELNGETYYVNVH
jgi:antirestriction protein